MAINDYLEQKFPVECKGRDMKGREVLSTPVSAVVTIYMRPGSDTISSGVDCPFNSGGHGEMCKASGEKARCPYRVDIPGYTRSK